MNESQNKPIFSDYCNRYIFFRFAIYQVNEYQNKPIFSDDFINELHPCLNFIHVDVNCQQDRQNYRLS